MNQARCKYWTKTQIHKEFIYCHINVMSAINSLRTIIFIMKSILLIGIKCSYAVTGIMRFYEKQF